MLNRQKIILALLSKVNRPLSRTVFVKFMFLMRHETELKNDSTFYDFVPYKFGPFSFALYRELDNLKRDGCVISDEESVGLCEHSLKLAEEKAEELSPSIKRAIDYVVTRYGGMSHSAILKDVYSRFPWYAIKSELAELRPTPLRHPAKTRPAVYTAGYEGKSVDSFFNRLLKRGIELIVDVRANPVSRRYGFSKRRFREIANKLGLDYRHTPSLGIPSGYRVNLKDYDSYQRLLDRYEREILPKVEIEIEEVADLMQEKPAVLICVEKDVRCCHRSRLAEAVSRKNRLEVEHI